VRILKQLCEESMWEGTEASHQQPAPTCGSATLEVDPLVKVKPPADGNPDRHLDYNLMRDSEPEVPAKMPPNS